MTDLLSPQSAAALLTENPADAARILARLDIEACRFVPTVDSAGKPPLVETGMAGFGQPVSGYLAFTSAEVTALHAAGKKAILVCDGHKENWDQHENPDGLIVTVHKQTSINAHFLNQTAYQACVLIDNFQNPTFMFNQSEGSLVLDPHQSLKTGSKVIIDPVFGRLWTAPQVTLLPVPDYVASLQNALQNTFASVQYPEIAFHMSLPGELLSITNLCGTYGATAAVGLYRTEHDLRATLGDTPEAVNNLESIYHGFVPNQLNHWATAAFHFDLRSNYRLVDMHGLRDLIPDNIASGFAKGEDHQPESKIFRLRISLYWHQLRNALTRGGERLSLKNPKTIIIPSVCTKEEVLVFKNHVAAATEEYLPAKQRHLIHFGVMIETAEAVANIAQIAPLCDTLCFGTNDLTAAFTNLSRCKLDHSGWMRERGYLGRSPFEVLVPEVLAPLAQAVKAARKANPAIRLNVCGFQVGGHDLPSQLAVLEMGVDCLTIPPNANSVLRTQAAIIRHKAGVAPV